MYELSSLNRKDVVWGDDKQGSVCVTFAPPLAMVLSIPPSSCNDCGLDVTNVTRKWVEIFAAGIPVPLANIKSMPPFILTCSLPLNAVVHLVVHQVPSAQSHCLAAEDIRGSCCLVGKGWRETPGKHGAGNVTWKILATEGHCTISVNVGWFIIIINIIIIVRIFCKEGALKASWGYKVF